MCWSLVDTICVCRLNKLCVCFTEAQQTRSSHLSSIRGQFVDGCVVCAYRGVGWACCAYINVLCVADVVCNSEGAHTYSDVCTPHIADY